MTDKNDNSGLRGGVQDDITTRLAGLMQRDLVFVMRFIGESHHLMQSHFQAFILRELAMTGVTPDTHPMLHAFAEKHALMLREFVFSGVSLSRQFRVEEIEQLTGDTMIQVDVWDQLRNHIGIVRKPVQKPVAGPANRSRSLESTRRQGHPRRLNDILPPDTEDLTMAPQPQTDLDLMKRRVELVGDISALTSRALKLTQALSGIEMDILRLELEIGRSAVSPKLAQELQDTEDRAETQRKAHADCMEEIAAVEADVAALDREIAATTGG